MKKIKLFLRFIKKLYLIPSSIVQSFIRTIHSQNMYISQANIVTMTHQETFGPYKNKHFGEDVAIIATGPSLNKYKPLDNVINIGMNKAFFADNINLSYYFSFDHIANKDYIEKIAEYKDITKFYGQLQPSYFCLKEIKAGKGIMPESIILKHNAKKFYIYGKWPLTPLFIKPDIDKTWLVDGGSVVFSAMQFALFTNPKRIYLVGCDCSSGYFDGKTGADASHLVKSWKELKKFAEIYYPDTEIISVNPVGLKGMFKDLYQDGE